MKETLNALLTEYGRIAISTYFAIFGLTLSGFYLALVSGFQPESFTEGASTLGAAWVAAKLTQPLRIAATLVLTPMIGAMLKRKGRAVTTREFRDR